MSQNQDKGTAIPKVYIYLCPNTPGFQPRPPSLDVQRYNGSNQEEKEALEER